MLLICHSLGGTILKQALCMANAQLYRYEYLVNQISGIIFFSTPHLGHDRAETLEKTVSAIKATTKASFKLSPSRAEEEAAILFDLSVRFEGADIHSPILSVYELIPTKVQEGRFKSKKVMVSYSKDNTQCRKCHYLYISGLVCQNTQTLRWTETDRRQGHVHDTSQ